MDGLDDLLRLPLLEDLLPDLVDGEEPLRSRSARIRALAGRRVISPEALGLRVSLNVLPSIMTEGVELVDGPTSSKSVFGNRTDDRLAVGKPLLLQRHTFGTALAKGMATGGDIMNRHTLTFVALLSIPALGEAQTASDQAQAVADVLSVLESENAYAAQNCGYFSDVVNLCHSGDPAGACAGIGIPLYPANGPEFIEPRLARHSPYLESGYVRLWTPDWRPPFLGGSCDAQSVVNYCYLAAPENPTSGRPSFAGTADGTVYVDRTGAFMACPVAIGTPTVRWPELTTPPPGSTLPASSVTFRWTRTTSHPTRFVSDSGPRRARVTSLIAARSLRWVPST